MSTAAVYIRSVFPVIAFNNFAIKQIGSSEREYYSEG